MEVINVYLFNRDKIRKRIIIGIVLAIVVIAIATFIGVHNYKHRYDDYEFLFLDDAYTKMEKISLEVNEIYEIKIDNSYLADGIEYDKFEIYESKDYKIDNHKIKALNSGKWEINIRLINNKDKIIYGGSFCCVYCYDVDEMIKINTPEDLSNMSNNLDGHYILNDNIDLSKIENFEPIGNFPYGNEFRGFFINPNNYTISNLTIKTAVEIYHGPYGGCLGGLFGSIKDAYIDNIILDNVYIDVSDFEGESSSYAGGLVGDIAGSLVLNCSVNGTIMGQYSVGGIAGVCGNTTIKGCSFSGLVIQQNSSDELSAAGGLAGYLYVQVVFGVKHCSVENNNVMGTVKSECLAGKLAGYIFGSQYFNNILNTSCDAPNIYYFGKVYNNDY